MSLNHFPNPSVCISWTESSVPLGLLLPTISQLKGELITFSISFVVYAVSKINCNSGYCLIKFKILLLNRDICLGSVTNLYH